MNVTVIQKANGAPIIVSQEAWDSVYSKYPDKYQLQGTTSSPVASNPVNAVVTPIPTPVQSPAQSSSIPFKAGLSPAQQQSITQLQTKPADQWTATDKANWSYATNNAPFPSAQTQQSSPQAPAPSTGTPVTDIHFISGLSEAQKQSIQQLTTKPKEQWSQTDVTNWNYATNGSVPPAAPTQQNPQSQSNPQSGTTTPAPSTSVTPPEVHPADQDWINGLYQKYFDRNATSAELQNWSKETPQTLEPFLKQEATKYNYRSKFFSTTDNQNLQTALSTIDGSNLPPDIKELWKSVVNGYPQGVEYNSAQILDTFNNIKNNTIDPYFKQLADTAATDIKTNMSQMDQARAQELEQQRLNEAQSVRNTQSGLEKTGMTFTGNAVRTLGATAAIGQTDANGSQLPAQTPFGGTPIEGELNTQNRLIASSSAARQQALQTTAARNAENTLGTAGAQAQGFTSGLAGGVTGSQDIQKQQQYGSTLNQIIANYQKKQTALTNQQYSV